MRNLFSRLVAAACILACALPLIACIDEADARIRRNVGLVAGGGGGGGPVAFDAVDTTSTGTNSSTTVTCNHTVGSLTDGIVLVSVTWSDTATGTATVSSVASNASGTPALTQVSSALFNKTPADSSADTGVDWWYLLSPASGATTFTVTMSEDTDEMMCKSISFSGVDQSTPIADVQTVDRTGNTSTTITHTTASGDMVVGALHQTSPTTAGVSVNTGTSRWSTSINNWWGMAMFGGTNAASGASTDLAWTHFTDKDPLFSSLVLKGS